MAWLDRSLDPPTLEGALGGMEAGVHLVGIIAEASWDTFERVHAAGTRNMVAAAQQAGVKRFIHVSALGTQPWAVSRYHQSKWAAEELFQRSGLEFAIFRPSLIYGPGDQFINLFAKIALWSPVVPLLGISRARFQPVAAQPRPPHHAAGGQREGMCGPPMSCSGSSKFRWQQGLQGI